MPEPATLDDASERASAARGRAGAASGPVVIEARGVHKSFRIPSQRVDSLKERVAHPFTNIEYHTNHALKDVSFDVHRGEFFGIVGRNGSGKSSLLKILASIYRADAGRVRMAGSVSPFIELGVGFNPDLTARENGVLNGVLMGLTLREARRRLDAVLEFAGLEEFVDLKLKNYSSGMTVRLAFAIMVQADADIMLIDEVLAVGDAAFAQKCMDVFHAKRRAGRTIVLVTHDMTTVQSLCHRAMLIHDGEVTFIGDPEETAMNYLRMNFAGLVEDVGKPAPEQDPTLDLNARVVSAQLRNASGETVENVEADEDILVDVVLEVARELASPIFVLHILNSDGVVVVGFQRALEGTIAAGRRIRLAGTIENRLVPGSYSLDCWVRRDREGGDMALQPIRLLHFVVFGTAPRHGLVNPRTDIEPVLDEDPRR